MAKAPTSHKRALSRPVLDQTFTIRSQNAQYVLQCGHSLMLVVRALYAISVVLRIVGEEADMDRIEDLVSERIEAVAKRLGDEHARLKRLADDFVHAAIARLGGSRLRSAQRRKLRAGPRPNDARRTGCSFVSGAHYE